MEKLFLVLLLACICCISAQTIQGVELYSSDNNIPTYDTYQCLFADLNCSSFTNTIVKLDLNRPNFKSLTAQAGMYVGTTPYPGGCCAPFPDPTLPNSYTYTTFLPNGTYLPNVQFKMNTPGPVYVTVNCLTSNCEYNLAISEAESDELTPPSPQVHSSEVAPNKQKSKAPTFDVMKLMMRNRMTVNATVNFNNYVTVALPICATTLSSIYGNNANVCLEATVVGTRLGYLFYQQITTTNSPAPINFWYRRQPDNQEPIRDLTGAFRLPINRYRTLPISINALQNVSSVYQTIIGYGGEGENDPQPNYYVATYEWFSCTS